jgi:hypothetical protein
MSFLSEDVVHEVDDIAIEGPLFVILTLLDVRKLSRTTSEPYPPPLYRRIRLLL